MTLRVTWAQALAWRLERQLLEPLGTLDAVGVVRRLCGVQAQVASSADLAVRLRQSNPERSGVAQALADGRLVKTWAMRGTLHLLPANEAGRYLSLIADGRSWATPAWERYFGLSAAQIEGLRDVVKEILDGKVLTREELNGQIVRRPGYEHLGDELRSGWGTLFKPLAFQGDIVFGPSQGTRVTFARPEQLSSHWRELPAADESAPLVIESYLGAYGPATSTQLRRWLARGRISSKQNRHWFELLGDAVTRVDVDGEEMFMRAQDTDSLASARPNDTVRLLGGFDQWVLGPGTEDPHVIPPGRRPAVSKTAGWIAQLVLLGGVVRGTWTLDADRVLVDWFSDGGKPPAPALGAEVDRLSGLIGRPLHLDLVPAS